MIFCQIYYLYIASRIARVQDQMLLIAYLHG